MFTVCCVNDRNSELVNTSFLIAYWNNVISLEVGHAYCIFMCNTDEVFFGFIFYAFSAEECV